MILPNVVPAQHADELYGLPSGSAVFQLLTGTASYTVPAGFTLVIHGFASTTGAATAQSLTIGGVTIHTGTPGSTGVVQVADRMRLATQNGSTTMAAMSNGVVATAAAGLSLQGGTGTAVAEDAPFLFWPIAAGLTVATTGDSYTFTFWGTLIPN